METNETKQPAKSAAPDRVEVYIPRGNAKDDPNLLVSVNGKNYLLPKGKNSLVPPEVKYEIERSRRAEEKLNENKSAMIEEAIRQAMNPVLK